MISTSSRTSEGILYERHTVRETANPVVLFTGVGVEPGEYTNTAPEELAEATGESFVVYQPGVSLLRNKGLYTTGTERKQLNAALEVVEGRQFTPVTHSYSAMLGARLLDPSFREETSATNAMPGVITALMTTVNDGLHHKDGKVRTILGVPGYYVFLFGQYVPLLSPLYPLGKNTDHEHFDQRDSLTPKQIASPWIDSRSGYACFRAPYEHVQPDQKGLGLVTLGDNIFSADLQREKLEVMGCDIEEIDTGHRWMSGRDKQKAIDAIVAKHFANLQ